jgi:RNA helicase./Putative viral replication protein.
MSTSRHFIITFFDDSLTEEKIVEYLKKIKSLRGAIGQIEKCPSTGKLHYQAYFEFENAVRITAITKTLNGAHVERRLGSRQDAITYCSKEESRVSGPWTFGRMDLKPGVRSDIEALKEDCLTRKSLKTISEDHFGLFLKYQRGITSFLLLHQSPRDWVMDIQIYFGETGTGKTRLCYDEAKSSGHRVYPLPQNDKGTVWWDSYDGEDVVLIDDFYGWIKLSYMLKLLDRYPMLIQVKGNFLHFISKKIVITSNKNPFDWYCWPDSTLKKAFFRRVTKITQFKSIDEREDWPILLDNI